ncbi:MAG: nucleotide pyrophosphatase [Cytophagaceae bacterium]|nr:nucleotide pyrophosphatase [Cytophagaceae bacterium]|tara:strand:+ start:8789 stop:10045 length:1257 start_codon:yes stop_codon:yes gene_type:complete
MKTKLILFLFAAISLSLQAQKTTQNKKVVFIIVDGIAHDMLAKAQTPNLDKIAAKGGIAHSQVGGEKDGYSQTPTISAVGYNSLLTGTWVNKHNVYGNSIKQPNYNYPTIFRLFENTYPDGETAIFSTWEDNRTKLLGDGLVGTNFLKTTYSYDGFEKDTVAFPHDDERQYIKHIDDKVAREAARYIYKNGPDLSWVYLEFSDDMGHKYGDGKQLYDAISFEDGLVGLIYDAVDAREKQHGEDWLFVVTTDHGRSEETGKGHGGQSDRERSTWIVMNKEGNSYFKNDTTAVVDIAPTIAGFLDIKTPHHVRQEWDGVPLIEDVAFTKLHASHEGDTLTVSWKVGDAAPKKGELYLAASNNAGYGGEDKYTLLGKVDLKKEGATFTVNASSPILKILLKTQNQYLNTWVVESNNNKPSK